VVKEITFDKAKAHDFYVKFILSSEKQALMTEYGFSANGMVSAVDWELFAAILTNTRRRSGYGSDLEGYEIKSAKMGSSFEYQYHKHTGIEKLDDEIGVSHIYISYGDKYNDIDIRVLPAASLSKTFEGWRQGLKENYKKGSTRQRYRKSISFGFVCNHGQVIMRIRDQKIAEI
jgi:hypothetical protein